MSRTLLTSCECTHRSYWHEEDENENAVGRCVRLDCPCKKYRPNSEPKERAK